MSTAPEIAGYKILDELGHGGMGRVFLAEQLATKRLVALKVMLAEHDSTPSSPRRTCPCARRSGCSCCSAAPSSTPTSAASCTAT